MSDRKAMLIIAWVYGALALSIVTNAALGLGLYQYVSDYNSLLTWACEAGNGGHECGED
jgi:hypothetical protein